LAWLNAGNAREKSRRSIFFTKSYAALRDLIAIEALESHLADRQYDLCIEYSARAVFVQTFLSLPPKAVMPAVSIR
jgi:hypothetical protein